MEEETAKAQEFFAHTPPQASKVWHLLQDHLGGVAKLASAYGLPLGLEVEANMCGLLHDLGKYGALFQRRLMGMEQGIDHWTAGAAWALRQFECSGGALVIQGHHIGLQSGSKSSLNALYKLELRPGDTRRLSDPDPEHLVNLCAVNGVTLPTAKIRSPISLAADAMLRTRILFSCLVDADFVDTESHFQRPPDGKKTLRPAGPCLDPQVALVHFSKYIDAQNWRVADNIRSLRETVSEDCAVASAGEIGTYTLTAPTGSGKTLAMLRFALLHAKKHELRRIIVVLPFLTLIDQTAQIYRDVFGALGPEFVLEDHSIAGNGADESNSDVRKRSALLAENWDAPIVITTNVRFLESLHANRTSACRKLHRVGKAVVLMDEVQSIPTQLAVPTLAAISGLSNQFGSTAVFATATQPAFETLNSPVSAISEGGWAPTEIISNVPDAFSASARVSTEWRDGPASWEELSVEISSRKGSLAIVNLKRHAMDLYAALRTVVDASKLIHISTNMVVAHRQQVLASVRAEGIERDGWLVATQCVEAGVDLDFRTVYRAWAPLDSIAQAAGRCNRNALAQSGNVIVFDPADVGFPDPSYRQATQVAKRIVLSNPGAELNQPSLFKAYFSELYRARGTADCSSNDELIQAIIAQDYVRVAELYRLIPTAGVNVFVPIGNLLGAEHSERNGKISAKLKSGVTRKMIREMRPYSVSTFLRKDHNLPLSPIRTIDGEVLEDWFELTVPAAYDGDLGLLTQNYQAEYIV